MFLFYMLVEEDHETVAGAVAKRTISQFCKRDDMRCTSVLTSFNDARSANYSFEISSFFIIAFVSLLLP